MIFKNKTIAWAILCLTSWMLSSCGHEETVTQREAYKVPILLEAGSQLDFTRAGIDIQGSLFEEGEQVNVYMTANGATDGTTTIGSQPTVFTVAAPEAGSNVNRLNPPTGSTFYYPPGDNVTMEVKAYYPTTVQKDGTSFLVQTNQSSDDNYQASDLMCAFVTEWEKGTQPIHLQFAHKMAKIIVNASGEDGVYIKGIKLHNYLPEARITNPSTSPVISATGTATDITVASVSSGGIPGSTLSGAALIPPQTITTDFVEVETVYNGTDRTVTFTLDSKTFVSGKVYTVNIGISPLNYDNNPAYINIPWTDNAGTLTVGAYGSAGLKIEGLNQSVFTYDGTAKVPKPTSVTDGKQTNPRTLIEHEHYELEYHNNVDAGTGLMVAKGIGEYDGIVAVKTFTINQATGIVKWSNTGTITMSYRRNALVDNTLSVNGDGTMEYSFSGDAVAFENNGKIYVNVNQVTGTGTITATMKGDKNYTEASSSFKLTVTPGSLNTMTITVDDSGCTYTGNEVHPAVTVRDGDANLVENYDYSLGYVNAIDAGTNTATLTITAMGSYGSSSTTRNYSIHKASNILTINSPANPLDCGASATFYSGHQTPIETTTATGASPETRPYTIPTRETRTVSSDPETFSAAGVATFGSNLMVYSSSNNSVATVNSTSGLITAVSPGTSTITATITCPTNSNGVKNYDDVTQAISVTVEKMTYIYTYNGRTRRRGGSFNAGRPRNINSFTYAQMDGSAQEFVLTSSSKARRVTVELVGAGGGCDNNGDGGKGGRIVAYKDYPANSGAETWYVYVGGGGQTNVNNSSYNATTWGKYEIDNNTTHKDDDPDYIVDFSGYSKYDDVPEANRVSVAYYGGGGWNGGGSAGPGAFSGAGGGATDIRIGGHGTGCTTADPARGNPTNSSTDNRVLIAGGGGGASNNSAHGQDGNYDGDGSSAGNNNALWRGSDKTNGDGGGGGGGYKGGLQGTDSQSGGGGGSNFIGEGWTRVENGTSDNGPTGSRMNDHPWNDMIFPGWAIISYRYK